MNAIRRAVECAGGPSRVAEVMGVTPQAVAFWRDGKRGLPERLAARLETATGCVVRRWDMFPLDWHRIWPELVGTPGAPEVSQHDVVPCGDRAVEVGRAA